VETIREAGLYADGGNLYLRVDEEAHKVWTFIFTYHGRRKEMGLGSLLAVSLAAARDRADEARKLCAAGINPIEKRRADKARSAENTFGDLAFALIDGWELAWKNPKHRQQWRNTLTTYAKPIWKMSLDAITTDDVLAILRPIWMTKAETATGYGHGLSGC
jgi:hypothetical protein